MSVRERNGGKGLENLRKRGEVLESTRKWRKERTAREGLENHRSKRTSESKKNGANRSTATGESEKAARGARK